MTAKLFTRPLLVLDTETTSLPRDSWATVIEIGAVLLDVYGVEQASAGCLIRPPDEIPPEADKALSINQITRESIATAYPLDMASRFMWAMVHAADPTITAFNVDFDREMIERSRIPFGASGRWGRCIMLAAMSVMGPAGALPERGRGDRWKWPRLAEAADFFGVKVEGIPHRAITDARTAAGVAVELAKRGGYEQ